MLELIGILTMLIDHLGVVFYEHNLMMQVVGRISFVIYAYLVSVGASKSRCVKKYLARILFIAVISQFFYYHIIAYRLNVCFTLSAGLLTIMIKDSTKINKIIKGSLILLTSVLATVFGFEYGAYGVFTIFLFYVCHNRLNTFIVQFSNLVLSIWLFSFPMYQFYSLFAFIFIFIFEKKGSITNFVG